MPHGKQSLKSYFVQGKYIFFYNILERLTFFAFYISIARYVDKELYGLIVSVSAFTNIIASIFDLGLPFFIQRESATNSISRQTLLNILSLKIILMIFLLPLPLIYFSGDQRYFLIILLIALVNFYHPLNQILVFYLNGKDKFEINFKSVFYSRLILFTLLFFYTIYRVKIEISLLTILSILVFQSLYLSRFIRGFNLIKSSKVFDLKDAMNIVRKSLPFGLGVIFTMAYDRIDVLILNHFWGKTDVAVYSVAYSLIRHTSIFSTVILLQSYNKLSRFYLQEKRIHLNLIVKEIIVLIFVASGLVFVYLNWGDLIISIIFTKKFLVSSEYLKTISIAIPLIFLNNFTGILLNSQRLEKVTMMTTFLGLIINVSSNFILIPRLGIYGAIYSTIITEGTILFSQLFFLIKKSFEYR